MSSQTKPTHTPSDKYPRRNRFFYLMFPVLALMSPIVGNLNGVSYTVSTGSSHINPGSHFGILLILSSLFLLTLGALVAWLDAPGKSKSRKLNFIKYALITGIVFLAIDMIYGGHKIADALRPLGDEMKTVKIWRIIFAVVVLPALFVLLRFLRENLPILLVTVFGSIFISSIFLHFFPVDQSPKFDLEDSKGNHQLPPVIHIILDEMIGAEGIDRSVAGGEATYQRIRRFHKQFGFRLYGKAFSRHWYSGISIPNIMNFDYLDTTYGTQANYLSQRKIVSTGFKYLYLNKVKFFDVMSQRGYDINVYQTSHINFCERPDIHNCNTLNTFNPASTYVSLPKEYSSGSLPVYSIIFSILAQKLEGSYFSSLSKRLIRVFDKDGYFSQRFDVQGFKTVVR